MKSTSKFLLLLLLIGLMLAACQQEAEPEASIDLAGTAWTLSSLNGELPVAGTAVTLEFGTDGTVFGSDGCNRFNTTYTQDGSSLTINQSAGISTMMACEEPVMNQATAYMTALNETTSFTASGNQLSLHNGDEVLATFVAGTADGSDTGTMPEASTDLAGTNWILSSLGGELPIPGTAVTLQFGEDGTVSGTDGCNQYNTTFTVDSNGLTFNQATGATTMMACPEPVMDQAMAFSEALAATTSFAMTEDELFLMNGDEVLATFVAVSTDLAGTEWNVVSYNNGREAVVSLVLGTEISANFGVEGDLTGNAGCNQYFTDYTASEGNIEIGVAGTTFRFCPEPPGVMEQEAEYLAALASAATYSFQGNSLQMRTADDQLAVVMIRKIVVDLPEPEPSTPSGRVTAPQGLNIRSGPGVNFPIIGFAQFGDKGEIVGRSADNLWWAVAVPSAPDGLGWGSADFILATNVEDVPVIEVAPPIVIAPTAAATPTPLPVPTATPTPQISFTADSTSISQGECTTLRWSVENIQAVWVYPQGQRYENFPRTGQGSEQVCPTSTTTYEMRVQMRDGSTVFSQVTITVTGAVNSLADTRWDVINYNNGRDAVVSVLSGTFITLSFSADGQLTGTAGCNNYFSSYQVSGSNITVSPPGASAQFCTDPEGIMDQEAEFLAALQSAATFQISGNRLEMRTAGNQIAIVANQAP